MPKFTKADWAIFILSMVAFAYLICMGILVAWKSC